MRSAGLTASALVLATACSTSPKEVPIEPWSCSPRVDLSSIWEHLSDRYDADQDGRILMAEYGRGDVRFANYDRNEDGILEAEDFPLDSHFNGFSHMLLRRADADEDERVTPEEWRSFTSDFDVNEDGRVTRPEVEETMGAWTNDWRIFLLSFDQDSDGDFDDIDLELAFRDQDYNGDGALTGKELSGWKPTMADNEQEPPAVGDLAPDFSLGYAGAPGRTFALSANGRADGNARPTALIFGSYT